MYALRGWQVCAIFKHVRLRQLRLRIVLLTRGVGTPCVPSGILLLDTGAVNKRAVRHMPSASRVSGGVGGTGRMRAWQPCATSWQLGVHALSWRELPGRQG